MEKVELLIDGEHVKYMDMDTGIPWTKLRKFIINDDAVKKRVSDKDIRSILFRLHPMNEGDNRFINLLVNKALDYASYKPVGIHFKEN